MRSPCTALLAAVLLAGCGTIGERPDEAGMSLTYYAGSTGLPGIQGAMGAAMGRGLEVEGCLYREWGEQRVSGAVLLVSRACRVEVD